MSSPRNCDHATVSPLSMHTGVSKLIDAQAWRIVKLTESVG